jgi:predicted dehydrogenase
MGYRFSQAIRKSGNDIATIFDLSEAPYALICEPQLAPLHVRDLKAVLASDADAVAICTTADSHVPIARDLIEAGFKRLIIEKPLSQSLADAQTLAELATSAQARIVVNHGRRYCHNTHQLKAIDGSPDAGALRSVVIKMGGGSLGCVGTHWIDLCNNLLGGKPERIFASLSPMTPDNNRGAQFFDPGGTAILFYTEGRRAIIDMGDDVGIVGGADFIFERGIVSWKSESETWSYLHRRAEDRDKPLTLYGLPLAASEFHSIPPNLVDYAAAAIHDLLSDEPVECGIDKAVETMEAFAAIRWSATIGCPVTLPLGEAAKNEIYRIP